jgi:hypothetical protein
MMQSLFFTAHPAFHAIINCTSLILTSWPDVLACGNLHRDGDSAVALVAHH